MNKQHNTVKRTRKLGQAPIIDEPGLQRPFIRSLELLLSAGMWLLLLYFLQLLFTSLVWAVGGMFLYQQILLPLPIQGSKDLFIGTICYSIVVFIVLLGWAQWNYWRYGRLERRKLRPPVTDAVIAANFDVSQAAVKTIQQAKFVHIKPQLTGLDFTLEQHLKKQ